MMEQKQKSACFLHSDGQFLHAWSHCVNWVSHGGVYTKKLETDGSQGYSCLHCVFFGFTTKHIDKAFTVLTYVF